MQKRLALPSLLILALASSGCENATTDNNYSASDDYRIDYNEEQCYGEVDSVYIVITNADNSFGPQQLRLGEEFLGWTLDSIGYREVPVGNAWYTEITANFSGGVVVSGELQYHDWPQVPFTPFMVHEQYRHLFPRLADDIVSSVFINPIYLLHEQTMSTLAAHNATVLWELVNEENPVMEMSVRLDNFFIRRLRGPDGFFAVYGLGVVDESHLVEIISFATSVQRYP